MGVKKLKNIPEELLTLELKITEYDQISTIFVWFNKIEIWTKFSISPVILTADRTNKADHILEIPGLREFCGYCFNIRFMNVCHK